MDVNSVHVCSMTSSVHEFFNCPSGDKQRPSELKTEVEFKCSAAFQHTVRRNNHRSDVRVYMSSAEEVEVTHAR